MLRHRWWTAIALAGLAPVLAGGQVVRGIVTDSTNRPISGVVVMLIDGASQSRARALSDERGEFRIAAPGAGTYSLRTLRIGFRPTTTTPIEVRVGGEVAQRVVVAGLPITLDTIRVADRNACRTFTDSGAATYAVWEQIRAALTATELTTGFRNIAATTVAYERVLDPKGNKVLQQKATVSTGYVNRPWLSLSPDSLRRMGYVVTERDNSVVYYAPGIDVLLSPAFANDHCFRVTRDARRAELIGLAFEPTPDRKRTAEISGTLWVDRASSQLRRLEFQFANVPFEQGEMAGGDLQFVRMRDGTWAISQWNIRMPAFTSVVRPGHGAERQLAEIQVAGGQLAVARRGTDTLWAQPTVVLSGTIRDSVSGAGIAGGRITLVGTDLAARTDDRGRFSLSGILPGVYEAEIRTPSLDSLAASHRASFEFVDPNVHPDWRIPNAQQLMATVCSGGALRDASRGIVVGRARVRGDTAAVRNLSIVAEWQPTDTSGIVRQAKVQGSAEGFFRLCGVPTNTTVKLRAVADGAETADETTVKLQGGTRLARTELTLERLEALAARGSVFTGVVVADSTHAPIPLAEVALPDLNKSETTNSRGEFRITGIPAGEHRVSVRRIGYGAADTRLAFTGTGTVERRVVLGRAITLEAVQVTATAYDKLRRSFDDNMRVGLGHFMTRDQIAKYDGMELATVLSTLPTTGVANGNGHSWVTSRRRPLPPCPGNPPSDGCLQQHGFYIPSYFERMQGMPKECWAHVWVDGVLQNGTREPAEPFDLKEIPPYRIDKMEFYAGASETPLQYSRMGSQCGVLVIWTRQYEPKPEKPPR